MDVHPPKNGINRYWSIPICLGTRMSKRCRSIGTPRSSESCGFWSPSIPVCSLFLLLLLLLLLLYLKCCSCLGSREQLPTLSSHLQLSFDFAKQCVTPLPSNARYAQKSPAEGDKNCWKVTAMLQPNPPDYHVPQEIPSSKFTVRPWQSSGLVQISFL